MIENSRIGHAADELEWSLAATIAPWKIAPDHNGDLTKIFAKSGSVSQYEYNTGHDTSDWRPGWQPGLVTSRESGRIVLDEDDEEFRDFMRQCGIPASPVKVLTGRPGGAQYHYDGRGLDPQDWPTQGSIYNAAGKQIGDVMSAGFVPAPGSIHPNGTRYRVAPDSHGETLEWQPEYTEAIRRWREAMGRREGGSYDRGGTGSGRNNALLAYKKELFYQRGLDEDDPQLHRLVLERNAQFDEPLSEREVWATVLKVKSWKRRWTLGVMQGLGEPGQEGSLAEAERRGHEASPAAALPLASGSHLSSVREEDPRSSERQVRIAGQGVCKALSRLLAEVRAIDPQKLWPQRIDAAATRKAVYERILSLAIEQGSHLVSWVASEIAEAVGAGISTVYRHLKALEHHGQLRILGEGRICISVSLKALRPRKRKAGDNRFQGRGAVGGPQGHEGRSDQASQAIPARGDENRAERDQLGAL